MSSIKCTRKINLKTSNKKMNLTSRSVCRTSHRGENSEPNEFLSQIISSPKIVYIQWYDAITTGDAGWTPADDIEDLIHLEPPVMHTVGIVLNDSPSYITLTDTVGPDETASVHTIPKCMVKRLQYIDNYIQGGTDL